jgi:carbamoyl-phosphate synthase small subunit
VGAELRLADGTAVAGSYFGADVPASGEVVFNTGMVGYVESLSDPSYRGQILVLTYPLAGSYGVPDPRVFHRLFESSRIHAAGLVVACCIREHSHHGAFLGLHEWLEREGIPGIEGIDTRSLTRKLRSHGTMPGWMVPSGYDAPPPPLPDFASDSLVSAVSVDQIVEIDPARRDGPRIGIVDCGCKLGIARELLDRGCRVTLIPHDHPPDPSLFDGILISNGPGDPAALHATISNVRMIIDAPDPVPVAGICLGCQLMALASGGETYKLPFGHRSQNQPCLQEGTSNCLITSQNHGFAVRRESLPAGWKVWYRNLNDGSVEGIRHESKPFMAVQFHPEGSPGPSDARGFFDGFLEEVRRRAR